MRSPVFPPSAFRARSEMPLALQSTRNARPLPPRSTNCRRLAPAAALVIGAALMACDSAEEPEAVASVVVSPATATLDALGDTVRLAAHASTGGGKAMANATFT